MNGKKRQVDAQKRTRAFGDHGGTDCIHAVWEWQMSGTCMFRDEDEYTGPCHWRTIGQFIVSLPTRPLKTKGGLFWSFKYTTGLKGK